MTKTRSQKSVTPTKPAADPKPVPAKQDVAKSVESKDAVRGMAKSGRFWKEPKQRITTIMKSKKKVGAKKLGELRAEKLRIKELSQSIKDARKTELEDKRKREAENKQRKEDNARKSEVVQVVKNTAKLKRMKKKQLRKIEKRDTTVVQKDPPKKAKAAEVTPMDT